MKIRTFRGQITLPKNWRNLPISNPKPALHNINARNKSGEKALASYRLETKIRTDVRQTDERMNGRTQGQPTWYHYRMVGYKKKKERKKRDPCLTIQKLKYNPVSWLSKVFNLSCRIYMKRTLSTITKTCLFKYTENFSTKKWKISDKKFWYFSYFCSKHRLWVLVITASTRRF